ncbi:MAG: hypothetical protein KAT29_03090 [Anaerolineales bacterium]|nr:hypothetical protein [Anaerolineales bacterium]
MGLNMIVESKYWIFTILLGFLILSGCSPAVPETPSLIPTVEQQVKPTNTQSKSTEAVTPSPTNTPVIPTEEAEFEPTETTEVKPIAPTSQADVQSISVNGQPGDYSFSVTVSSPDEGCSQYANWWEVLSPDGELIYRRVLLHSHVGEQPFTRSGGPVPIEPDTVVVVRAHMHLTGYGGKAMKGSVEQGFEPFELSPEAAAHLGEAPPLPEGCNF